MLHHSRILNAIGKISSWLAYHHSVPKLRWNRSMEFPNLATLGKRVEAGAAARWILDDMWKLMAFWLVKVWLCKAEDPEKCAACGGKHSAWSKQCSLRKREMLRIQVAKRNTFIRYNSEGSESVSSMNITSVATSSFFSTFKDIANEDMIDKDDEEYQTVQNKKAKKRSYRADVTKTSSYFEDAITKSYLARFDRVSEENRRRSQSSTKNFRLQTYKETSNSSTSQSQKQERQSLIFRDSNAVSIKKTRQNASEQLKWSMTENEQELSSVDIISSQAC